MTSCSRRSDPLDPTALQFMQTSPRSAQYFKSRASPLRLRFASRAILPFLFDDVPQQSNPGELRWTTCPKGRTLLAASAAAGAQASSSR